MDCRLDSRTRFALTDNLFIKVITFALRKALAAADYQFFDVAI